jgi:hypothetical protein
MHHSRITRTAATALAIGACLTPAALAQPDDPSRGPVDTSPATQTWRSPDAMDAADAAATAPQPAAGTDGRSPDAKDAADAAATAPQSDAGTDARSPDAKDAADGRNTAAAPEVVVLKAADPPPAGGFDVSDAGIGAGALLGVILLGLGGALLVTHRRHGHRPAH